MALPADDLTLALASGADLSVHVVIASSQFHSPRDPTLSIAFVAGDDIIRILGTGSLAVRTCYLFLHQNIELFAEIEIFELKEDLDLQFWAFELVEVEFVVDVGVVHLLDAHAIVQVFLVLVVQGLIGCVISLIPTLIFSNLSLEPGFLSGWYFLDSLLKASRMSSWLALTGSSE